MALAYCLHYIEHNKLAKITIYGEYLEKYPPADEVEIYENSSWSCSHGVERWRTNCGCNYGRYPSGKQEWRSPLREAMNWLRDRLAEVYETRTRQLVADVWEVRDKYISVINDRSAENMEKFITETAGSELDFSEKVEFLKLLEMQRNSMLMFTSCGWYFDDICGIETVQIMQYASRAIQLAKETDNKDFETEFENILQKAPTNLREYPTGRDAYERLVKSSSVDLNRVAVHFAISSIFTEYPKEEARIYCYSAKTEIYDRHEAGIQVLATGRALVKSAIVLEEYTVDFAVLYRGDPYIIASAAGRMSDGLFSAIQSDMKNAFRKGDLTEVIRLMNITFGGKSYSLWHLFKDEQRRILYELLETTWLEIEASFRHIYEHNYAIMQAMRGMNMPLPKALATPAEFILNEDLCKAIQNEPINLDRLQILAEEASRLSLQLDKPTIQYEADKKINRLMTQYTQKADDVGLLETLEITFKILLTVVTELNIQKAQNIFFDISKKTYPDMVSKAQAGDQPAQKWVEHFRNLGQYLGVTVQ
jgi:hypothetical protein